MGDIVLIGGRSKFNNNHILEDYLLSLVDKDIINILFIPTASHDSHKSINNFNDLFKNYKNVKISNLLLFGNYDLSEILRNDIIYIGGGNTKVLVNRIKELKIINYFKEAFDKGVILSGLSAGAIFYTKAGMGDSVSYIDNNHGYNYKMVEGIGLLDIIICPHYDHDDLDIFNDIINDYDCDAYALEDDTLIHFNNNSFNIKKAFNHKSIYQFRKNEGYLMKPLYEENRKIAVLGPKGTFSEVACNKYLSTIENKYDMEFYPSIYKTGEAIKELGIAILPFENTIDGYVKETMDLIINNDYEIVCDVTTKVAFAFVSNAKKIEDVKNVFVQFKAKGQCLNFLFEHNFNLLTTDSNIESYDRLKANDESYAAVIPMHKVKDGNFNLVINDINDQENNYTRFVVVTNQKYNKHYHGKIKCSLCAFSNEERPGLLFDLLKIFNDNKINLVSIMSRPTKEELGKYNFYIEVSVNENEKDKIDNVITEITKSNLFRINNLGIYTNI